MIAANLAGLLAFILLSQNHDQAQEAIFHKIDGIRLIQLDLLHLSDVEREFVASAHKNKQDEYYQIFERIQKRLANLPLDQNPTRQAQAKALAQRITEYKERFDAFKFYSAEELKELSSDPGLSAELRQSLGEARKIMTSLVQEIETQGQEHKHRLNGQMTLTIFVVLGFILLVGLLLLRQISSSIGRILNFVTQGLSTGDFSRRIEVQSKDELGHLAEAMNHFAAIQSRRIEAVQKIAQGVLSVSFEKVSDKDSFGNALGKMVENLRLKAEQLKVITKGDLQRLMTQATELDELGHSMNQMLDYLQNRSDLLQKIASGDLTLDISLASPKDQLGTSLQVMTRDLNDMIREITSRAQGLREAFDDIKDRSNTVSGATQQMAGNVGQMAERTQEMSGKIDSVTATASEISATMSLIKGSMVEIANSVGDISNLAGQACQITHQAKQLSDDANQAMEELNKTALEVSSITGRIKAVAEQTNMLALNANIEAVSAGKVGKGFAVVAMEVKKLSDQTFRLTESIAGQIEQIKKRSFTAINIIRDMSHIVDQVDSSSQKIVESTQQQRNATEEISRSVQETSMATDNIAKLMEDLSDGAKDIAANATELAHGAGDISRSMMEVNLLVKDSDQTSAEMLSMAKRFRLADDAIFDKAIGDHLAWKEKLEDFISGKASVYTARFTNHQHCRFGKWLYGGALERFKDYPEMQEIESVHEEVHDYIRCAVESLREKDRAKAEECIGKFHPKSKHLVELLVKVRDRSKSA